MLLNAVFLTLILSYTAIIALSSATQINNDDAVLRLHALNLADQQFALIESGANKNIPEDDLISYGLYLNKKDKPPTEFKVTTNISGESNLKKVKVTVKWKENILEFEKIVQAKE